MSGVEAAWLVASALLGFALSGWWYARREEPVRRRGLPAALRGAALFLILAAPVLPELGGGEREGGSAVLLDLSLSMRLPVRPGGTSRAEVAAEVAQGISSARLWIGFGDRLRPAEREEIAALTPSSGSRSRVAPAIEAAWAAGVDSVVLITDGELDDRATARHTAERLGIGVREIRVGAPLRRLGIRSVEVAERVRAGDTVTVVVGIAAGGVATGSAGARGVEVRVRGPAGGVSDTTVVAPSAGRLGRAALELIPTPPASPGGEWRRYVVELGRGADPLHSADVRTVWLHVFPRGAGAVLVSVLPDWEPRTLLPLLATAVEGGAEGYLQVAPGRFVRAGPEPEPIGDLTPLAFRVKSAALLVAQGAPAELPPWLREAVGRHPRLLFLARGAGRIAGDLTVGAPLPGEWYPDAVPPPGPVAAWLAEIPMTEVPPVARLFADGSPGGWTPLRLQRDREGPLRPFARIAERGSRRTAVVLAEGSWRWAAREGEGRRLYRALYAGIVSWLLERIEAEPVRLAEEAPEAGRPLRWRIAPSVHDLAVRVEDDAGQEVWRGEAAAADTLLEGPSLAAGEYRFTASGTLAGVGPAAGAFRTGRPFSVAEGLEELLPRAAVPALNVSARRGVGRSGGRGTRPALWPFVLAALLLGAEWARRRAIGLR